MIAIRKEKQGNLSARLHPRESGKSVLMRVNYGVIGGIVKKTASVIHKSRLYGKSDGNVISQNGCFDATE